MLLCLLGRYARAGFPFLSWVWWIRKAIHNGQVCEVFRCLPERKRETNLIENHKYGLIFEPMYLKLLDTLCFRAYTRENTKLASKLFCRCFRHFSNLKGLLERKGAQRILLIFLRNYLSLITNTWVRTEIEKFREKFNLLVLKFSGKALLN